MPIHYDNNYKRDLQTGCPIHTVTQRLEVQGAEDKQACL